MNSRKQSRSDTFIPTRQSLLSRLKSWEDQKSWREFFDLYGELIYSFARRAGLADPESQDVVQETMLAIARQMPGFNYDARLGSFKGWLRQVTRRRIVDQFRKKAPENLTGSAEQIDLLLENLPDSAGSDLDSLWEEEWQRQLLQNAIRKVKRKVRPKQFQMFDLYVTQQWPMKLIVDTLGVSPAQVYMAKMRVSRLLRAEVRLLQSHTA
jgi:RNA polymerase sigma factor (sigma-70 family)